jgi:hypothetical protein
MIEEVWSLVGMRDKPEDKGDFSLFKGRGARVGEKFHSSVKIGSSPYK